MSIGRRKILRGAVAVGFVGLFAGVAKIFSSQNTNTPTAIVEPSPETSMASTTPETSAAEVMTGNVIAKNGELGVGETFEFTSAAGIPAILFKSSSEKIYALSRVCTHEGCSVNFSSNDQTLICPCHGAQYEATSGARLGGPGRGDLQKINIEVQGDNIVELI